MASLSALLAAYHLTTGDVIHVSAGHVQPEHERGDHFGRLGGDDSGSEHGRRDLESRGYGRGEVRGGIEQRRRCDVGAPRR